MKNLLLLTFFCLFGSVISAQQLPDVYGLRYDSTSQNIQLSLLLPAANSTLNIVQVPGAQYSVLGSRAFDHLNSRYIFWGIDTAWVSRFYAVATDGSSISNPPNPAGTAAGTGLVEYDLATDSSFYIKHDFNSQQTFFMQLDLISGISTLVDTIQDVGFSANLVSTYDPNNHRYFFQGEDSSEPWPNNMKVWVLDARSGAVLNKLPIPRDSLFSCLEYDANTDELVGIYPSKDLSNPNNPVYRIWFCEVDLQTGQISNRINSPIEEGVNTGIALGTTDFDQLTRTLVFMSHNPDSGQVVNFIDVAADSVKFRAAFSPQVNSLQLSNRAFAEAKYGNPANTDSDISPLITLFPNPTTAGLVLSHPGPHPNYQWELWGQEGKFYAKGNWSGQLEETKLDLTPVAGGLYFLVIRTPGAQVPAKVFRVLKE